MLFTQFSLENKIHYFYAFVYQLIYSSSFRVVLRKVHALGGNAMTLTTLTNQGLSNYLLQETITFRSVSSDHKHFLLLCDELDADLDRAIGGIEHRLIFIPFNKANTMDYVLLAYYDGEPIGCAALRQYSPTEIEVKRFYVRPLYRRRNVGGQLLSQLIDRSKKEAYQSMLLETGEILQDALRLYQRFGFEKIERYGHYRDIPESPESLCMGLSIHSDPKK